VRSIHPKALMMPRIHGAAGLNCCRRHQPLSYTFRNPSRTCRPRVDPVRPVTTLPVRAALSGCDVRGDADAGSIQYCGMWLAPGSGRNALPKGMPCPKAPGPNCHMPTSTSTSTVEILAFPLMSWIKRDGSATDGC
jgi:hypothetical protein